MTLLLALFTAAAVLAGPTPTTTPTEPSAANRLLDGFEAQLVQDPASLRVGAEYRQLIIETGRYDRSIKLFERLAHDPQPAPEVLRDWLPDRWQPPPPR